MTIDKQMLQQLRDDINAALIEVGKKYDIELHAGNCSFTDIGMTFQLKGEVTDSDAVAEANQREFEAFVRYSDIDPRAFGQTFTNNGETFLICGVKPRNRKYPILAKGPNNATYKFPERVIAHHFPKAEQA